MAEAITEQQKERVRDIIDSEEMDYALNEYSDFEFITDEKFHAALASYRLARQQLLDMVDWVGDDEDYEEVDDDDDDFDDDDDYDEVYDDDMEDDDYDNDWDYIDNDWDDD